MKSFKIKCHGLALFKVNDDFNIDKYCFIPTGNHFFVKKCNKGFKISFRDSNSKKFKNFKVFHFYVTKVENDGVYYSARLM